MKENTAILERYLSQLWPDWPGEIPELLSYFEQLDLESGEYLPSQRGDIYFTVSGMLGKYLKDMPLRYVDKLEIIIVPLKPSKIQFKALASSTVLLLERAKLYRIVEEFPRGILLYDELLIKQQQSIDFRQALLELPKAMRLETLRARYPGIIALVSRIELASYLKISKEYLRQNL